jgi:hypothetical protein
LNRFSKVLACALVSTLSLSGNAAAANNEARVTQVIRDVKLLPSDAEARAAAVNDQVREGIAVRTGDKSRSELTFRDLTLSRLGANTIFSFDKAGRSVQLDAGSVLVRVPKNSGGGNVRTNAVSVAVTGTTLIIETTRAGRNKLIVLEGSSRLSLVKYRGQFRDVRGGQMLNVPPGAKTLPMPVNIDVNQVMKTHPLVVGFPPLPSRDLIAATGRNPRGANGEPVYQGQPVGGPPVATVPTFGLPPFAPGVRPSRPPRNPNDPQRPPPRRPTNPNDPSGR